MTDPTDFDAPTSRPAPPRLRAAVEAMTTAPETLTQPRRPTRWFRTAAATAVGAATLVAGIWLVPNLQPGPASGPEAANTAPSATGSTRPSSDPAPVQRTSPAVTALTKAEIGQQQASCLDDPNTMDSDWELVYAQRISVLGTDDTKDVLLFDDGEAHLTCIDEEWAGWARYDQAGKNEPRTPSAAVPAVVIDGVFTGTGSVDDDVLVDFGLQVSGEVVAGQIRTIGPDGTSEWGTVEARQGWVLAEISVPRGTTVEFRAVGADDTVLDIADVDGSIVTKLIERTDHHTGESTGPR